MHPFVHSFNPAISPPWQTRTDWDSFMTISKRFSELAAGHLGVRKDVVAVPLTHDTVDAMANPHGVVKDWKAGECEPVPGVSMPKLVVVERDYGAVHAKMSALGPLMDTLGATTKGVTFELGEEIDYLRHKNGAIRGGPADGRPSLVRDVDACEAILAMSGTWPPRALRRSRNGQGSGWLTSRPSTRANGSTSPTPRAHPSRSSPPRNGLVRRAAAGDTHRSPSTWSDSSPGTR
jgi:nitrate reductase alpha subunit